MPPLLFKNHEQNSTEAARVAALVRALGRATLENDILKKGIVHLEPEKRQEIVKAIHASHLNWFTPL